MSRGPTLRPEAVQAIASAVRGMPGPPTWEAVAHVAAVATGHAYTRQALAKHPGVVAAVRERRRGTVAREGRRRTGVVNPLRAEVEELKLECWKLEEQLILIAERAYALGIGDSLLMAPVSAVCHAGAATRA